MTKLLRVEKLEKNYLLPSQSLFSFKKDYIYVLRNISFELEKQQTLAIVGESGCGKSTLARQISYLEKPTSGECFLEEQSYSQLPVKDLRQSIQMIFQNPYASLNPRFTIRSILEEPLKINFPKLSSEERLYKIHQILQKIKMLPEDLNKYPHMFSGGQRQRWAIARVLMLAPKIVIADEPVSALDVSVQAQVLNLLKDLQEEFGISYIFISHDIGVVYYMADKVAVMYLGKIVEFGGIEDIYQHSLHPYTKALISAKRQFNEINKKVIVLSGELPSPLEKIQGCSFQSRCPVFQDICLQEMPEIKNVYGRLVACHRSDEMYQGTLKF